MLYLIVLLVLVQYKQADSKSGISSLNLVQCTRTSANENQLSVPYRVYGRSVYSPHFLFSFQILDQSSHIPKKVGSGIALLALPH